MSYSGLTMPPHPTAETGRPSLAATAVSQLRATLRIPLPPDTTRERSIRRPDSYLLQRCWESLCDVYATEAALTVARLATTRSPLSVAQALLRLSDSRPDEPARALILNELHSQTPVDGSGQSAVDDHRVSMLLIAATVSARLHADTAALSYLEHLDQIPRSWTRIVTTPDQRSLLAHTVAALPVHPLPAYLIDSGNRRHAEDGVNLVLAVAGAVDPDSPSGRRILARCVSAMDYAPLTTMHSHRAAVAVYARAGRTDVVLRQLATIDSIQEARRESGLALRKNEQQLLRQVKRPQADADVDFQVYTLQEAIRGMPLRSLPRDDRIELARRLATLGMKSDGWTAAGAASTLVELGAFKLAEEVVSHIAPDDPTRSEGSISLVRSLLANGEEEKALDESGKALAWAEAQEGKNAERATVWGLAHVFLDAGRPDRALSLLERRRVSVGFWDRMRQRFRDRVTDDELRDDRLRLRAWLQLGESGTEVDALVAKMRSWAPQLLEGDGLVTFLIEALLEPLLDGNRLDLVWELLPDLSNLMVAVHGERHAMHMRHVAELFVLHLGPAQVDAEVGARLHDFVTGIWTQDSRAGIWQLVHGIDGTLPLILALEGPGAAIEIATAVVDEAESWEAAPF